MVLYDYFRSSAAYRVRIALNLKGLAYDQRSFNAAALRLVDDLQAQVDRLQAEVDALRAERP